MTLGGYLSRRGLVRNSDLIFHFDSLESMRWPRSVDALTGQVGSLTRNGIAYGVDTEGWLYRANDNVHRYVRHFDSALGMWVPYFYLETMARTNAWTWSEDLTNGAWIKTSSTVTSNFRVAPDRAKSCDKIFEVAATATHGIERVPDSGWSTDTLQTISFYAKAAERTWVVIRTRNKVPTTLTSFFNLTTGVVGTLATGHTIRSVLSADGFYRIEVTFDAGSGADAGDIRIYLSTDGAAVTYLGDVTKGLFLWGFQHEVNQPIASSYIRTETVGVARVAEVFNWTFLRLPETDFTWYVRGTNYGYGIYGSGAHWGAIGSGSAANMSLFIGDNGNGNGHTYARLTTVAGTSTTGATTVPVEPRDEVEHRVVLAAAAGGGGLVQYGVSVNGAVEEIPADGTEVKLDSVYNQLAIVPMYTAGSGIRCVKVAKGIKTLAEMRNIF